jgi:hypothetical protein
MTPTVPPTVPSALRHLLTYNAASTARTAAAAGHSLGALWRGALSRSPWSTAARGALWWATMVDRRAPAR